MPHECYTSINASAMPIKKTTNTFFPSSISPTPAPVHWEPTHESWKAELPERSNLGIMVKCSAIPAHEHKLSQLKIISAIPAHEHKLSQLFKCSAIPAHEHKLSQLKIISAIPAHEHKLSQLFKCSAIPAHEHKLSQLKIISAIPAHEHKLSQLFKCSAIPAHEHKLSQLKIISAIPAHEHKLSQLVTIRRPAGLQDPRLFPCKARNHRRLPITSHPMHCLKAFCHWVLRQPQVASVVGAFSVDSGEPKDQ